ncbi:MAG: hypothetical protein Q7J16_01280 [Candidatus Cloacimonadales bacterium]|nr:hypothetical protein [Candidatus Cloacimonadales bacterium]
MKDLEKKLESMRIPNLEDEQFEYKLRRQLLDKYFKTSKSYKWKFRVVVAFSCLMLIFGCVTIIKPDIALKLNNLAFNKSTKIISAEQDCSSMENLAYTSIYNPNLTSKIDPDKFQEDKTYLVRKYTSSEEGGLMIVSEFNQTPKKQSAKRISF